MRCYSSRRGRRAASLVMALVAAILLAAAGTSQAYTIDTKTSTPTPSLFTDFGIGTTGYLEETVGQTFVTDSQDTVLDDFSFWITPCCYTSGAMKFKAYVMGWDTAAKHATGSVLYESDMASVPWGTTGVNGLKEYKFVTSGVALQPNQNYVAFVSTSAAGNTSNGGTDFAYTSDKYTGGGFFYLDNGTATGQWTQTAWTAQAGDTVFVANFSAPQNVPEPATMALLLTGAVPVLFRRRRRPGRLS